MVSPTVPHLPLSSRICVTPPVCVCVCVCVRVCVCVCVFVRERERARARERASERARERVRGSFSDTVFGISQDFLASCDTESAGGTRARARSQCQGP